MTKTKRIWVGGMVAAIVFGGFFFNSGLRDTLSRRKEILKAKKELKMVSEDIDRLRRDIDRLKKDPKAYERLVRRELGYLRAGEKEIRFVN